MGHLLAGPGGIGAGPQHRLDHVAFHKCRMHRVAAHRGFEARVKEIARRIPYNNSAENVAMNWGFLDPASKFVEGWLASPGHLENIEGNYTMTGIGVALSADSTYYATQIFILAR